MSNNLAMSENWRTLAGLSRGSGTVQDINKYVDWGWFFAKTNVQLLCGKGYFFETKNPKLKEFFNKFAKTARFQQVIEKVIWNLSRYGKLAIGLDKLKNEEGEDDFRMFPTSPKYIQFFFEVYEDLVGVTFWGEKHFTTQQLLITSEHWKPNGEIKREFFYNDKAVPLNQWPVEVPEEFKLPETDNWKKTYPSLPFVLFKNYGFSDDPDWKPAKRVIISFNKLMERFERDMRVNKSYVIMNVPQADKGKIQDAIKTSQLRDDYIINTKAVSDTKMAEIVPSTLNLVDYSTSIRDFVELIFNLAGYSYTDEKPGNRTTATEVSINNSKQTHTIIRKRTSFNEAMTLLMTKLFEAAGFKKPEFVWRLSEQTIVDETALIQNIITQINNGLMTRAEGVSEIRTLGSEDAENIIKNVDKEFKTNPVIQQQNKEVKDNNEANKSSQKSPRQ